MNTHQPPARAVENCARGLGEAAMKRLNIPEASLAFATKVAKNHPITRADMGLILEAHRRLDQAFITNSGWTPTAQTSFHLWGGRELRDFAERILDTVEIDEFTEPALVSVAPVSDGVEAGVAARLNPTPDFSWLARLDRELTRLDQELFAALQAATETAYLNALGRLSVHAAMRIQRIPKDLRDSGRVDMDEIVTIRAVVDELPRWLKWSAVPAGVAAELSLREQEQVDESLADLEVTSQRIMEDYLLKIAAVIAAATGLAEDDVLRQLVNLAGSLTDRARTAAEFLVAGLSGWVGNALQSRKLDDGPGPEPRTGWVDPSIVRRALRAVSPISVDDSEGLDHPPAQSVLQVLLQGSDVFRRAVNLSPTTEFTTGYKWNYGSKASRKVPFEPHFDLQQRGTRWVEPARAPGGYFPGDHPGCQCRLETTTLTRTDGGPWTDPATGEVWT